MKIHSPYRAETEAVSRFLRHYGLSSIDDMKQKVIHHALDHYGLSIHSFDFLKPGLCLRVTTENGPYFFKAFDSDINSDVDELMRSMDHFRSSGIPIPEVLKTDSGMTSAEYQGRPAYFVQEVEGVPVSPKDKKLLKKAASLLAGFHKTGEELYMDSEKPNNSLWSDCRIIDDFKVQFKRIQEWFDAGAHSFTAPETLVIHTARNYLSRGLPENLFTDLPKTYIHGDFKPDHVFQKDGEITGIIDFDFAGWAERLRDVISMAWSLNHDENDNPNFEHQMFFIEEYQKHIPLTDTEIDALPWSLLWANYFRVAALTGWQTRGVEVPTRRIKDAIADLKMVLEHFLS